MLCKCYRHEGNWGFYWAPEDGEIRSKQRNYRKQGECLIKDEFKEGRY